eukprot:6746340-Pyramimonas_sp.AAC.1
MQPAKTLTLSSASTAFAAAWASDARLLRERRSNLRDAQSGIIRIIAHPSLMDFSLARKIRYPPCELPSGLVAHEASE